MMKRRGVGFALQQPTRARPARPPTEDPDVNADDTGQPLQPALAVPAADEAPALTDAQALEDRRLRWRCRRGMLELDLLLLPYVERHFWRSTPEEQALFHSVLEEDDPVLFEWFHGRNLPAGDAPRLRLIERIRGRV